MTQPHPAAAPELPPLLTIQQVAALTGFQKSYVYVLVNRGHLPARVIGTKLRVRREDFTAWLDALPEKRPTEIEVEDGRILHLGAHRGAPDRDPA